MIKSKELYNIFKKYKLNYFTGVPDSTFKGWMTFLEKASKKDQLVNRIAVNECEAVFLAGSYHVATGCIGVTYMQNAGLGKTVDPLTSFTNPEVYNIPILLMIGWRGEPGIKDEPQHIKMGKITTSLLDIMSIPYKVLPDSISEIEKIIKTAYDYMSRKNLPFAIIIRKGLIEEENQTPEKRKYGMLREDAIMLISDFLQTTDLVVSTTGKTSRELWEYRETKDKTHKQDLLNIGGMGGASSLALEIALQTPSRRVFVFDGDGAILMQMGSLATIGNYNPKNLYHIIFDNNSHESTGGQPTVSNSVSFNEIALASGYRSAYVVNSQDGLLSKLKELQKGPAMIVVKIDKGSRKDLGRPTSKPIESKVAFMKNIGVKNV